MKRSLKVILSIGILLAFIVTSLGLAAIAVKSIKLNAASVSITVYKTYKLNVTFTPANATNKRVTFSSANKGIATVSSTGYIKGVKPGKTVVTVTSQANNKAVAKCTVQVKKLKPVTLKLYINIPGLNFEKYWGTNDVSKKMIEDTGVRLDFSYATDTENSKLNILIASGDFPDMMYLDPGIEQARKLVENDKVWALNELSDKYAPNFNAFLKQNKHILMKTRLDFNSKNVYLAPFYWLPKDKLDSDYVIKNFMGTTVIKQIYKELGSPVVKTTEDYINLLKQVKNKYPEMIPVQSSRGSGIDSFGNPSVIRVALANGGLNQIYMKQGDKYVRFYQDPNFVEVLKFANKLYTEKLLSQTEFTDKNEQLRANLWNGKVFSELNQDADNIDWYSRELAKVKPEYSWIMIEPFTIRPDVEYAGDGLSSAGAGGAGLMISKNTKYPDRTIRYIDYLYSEDAQKLIMYGIEGKHHVVKDGVPYYTDEIIQQSKEGTEVMFSKSGVSWMTIFRNDYWARISSTVMARDSNPDMYAALKIAGNHYKDFSFFTGIEAYSPDSEESKISAAIKDFYSTEVIKIIIGKPENVEKAYNSMIERMKGMGLEKLNDAITKVIGAKQAAINKLKD